MTYSLEFFPPKESSGITNVLNSYQSYQEKFDVEFVSVTYGAGGATRDKTLSLVSELVSLTPVYSHLTTVGHTREELVGLIEKLSLIGIEGIVALRGDNPTNLNIELSSIDLIKLIKEVNPDLKILAAGYPEVHGDCSSYSDSIEWSCKKIESGATGLITQVCMNSDAVFQYAWSILNSRNQSVGWNSIIPGLLPIHNFNQFSNFAKRCGAEVPLWMTKMFDNASDSKALDLASLLFQTQLETYRANFEHLHIYTLNKPTLR